MRKMRFGDSLDEIYEPDWLDKMSTKKKVFLLFLIVLFFSILYFSSPANAQDEKIDPRVARLREEQVERLKNPNFSYSVGAQESLEERITRLKQEQAELLKNESPEDRLIRLRVEELRAREALKKAISEAKKSSKDSAMRKVLGEEEKRMKYEEKVEGARKRVKISGCDPNDIWINPSVAPKFVIGSTVSIRVFNLEPVSVDIEDSRHGVVVKGLCPGGSMTLFRYRTPGSSDYINFRFIARSTLPDGRMAISESNTYSLSKYDWSSGRGNQEYEWMIQLRIIQSNIGR